MPNIPTITEMPIDKLPSTEMIDLVNKLASLNLGYLSIAVTILFFLGGAFYLFNFNPLKKGLELQEKKLNDLAKEVNDNLSSSKEEIKKDLEIFKKTQEDNLLKLSANRDDKVLSDVKTQILRFEKEFTEKFDSFAEEKDINLKTIILAEVSDKMRELEKSLNTTIDSTKTTTEKGISSIQKSMTLLKDGFKELKRIVRELQIFKYSQKGQMGAIILSIELLKEAIDEDSWRIESSLENLYTEIGTIKLEGDLLTSVEEQLVRLDKKPKYSPLVSKIRKLYQG